MKTARRIFLSLMVIALCYTAQAQNGHAIVEYYKVKPGQNSRYRALEKEAVKMHKIRQDAGIITQWSLYRKMYGGSEDPYDYIIVHFYDDFKKTGMSYPRELMDKHYTEEERTAFMKEARETRTLVRQEHYENLMLAEGGKPAKIIRINRYKVKPGTAGEYLQIREEVTKPLFEELIKRDMIAGWSLWRRQPYQPDFQYVSVDAFAELGDWYGMYGGNIFSEVHPDLDQAETMKKSRESRMMAGSEFWRLVEEVPPVQQ